MPANRHLESPSIATAPASTLEHPSTFERIEHATRLAAEAMSRRHAARQGLPGVAAILFAWRERRFATGICRDMLRLHADVTASRPELQGLPLYRRIVSAHHGGSLAVADAILERAGQSFAEWPVSRALNFRDVVHYLVVLEFIAANKNVRWIHADLKRLVSDAIPHEL